MAAIWRGTFYLKFFIPKNSELAERFLGLACFENFGVSLFCVACGSKFHKDLFQIHQGGVIHA